MKFTAACQKRGFTLVELMIVVSIIGVLAALAVVGVSRQLAMSKTAEAKLVVGAITRSAVTQYYRERSTSVILPSGGAADSTHVLCGAATPVPADFSRVRGIKYQPSPGPNADFMTGSHLVGWQCLGFAITQPIYFQYSYQVGGDYVSDGMPGAPLPSGAEGFEAAARGDLDGDGVASTMVRTGEVRGGEIVTSTQIYTNNDLE